MNELKQKTCIYKIIIFVFLFLDDAVKTSYLLELYIILRLILLKYT